MAWIESHDEVWEHHKTIRLCRKLGIGKAQAVGHLHALWHFTLRNAWKDANLEPWGDAEIERACFWEGENGSFVGALRECGFMDNFVVHDWLERAGKLVNDRLYNYKRKRDAVKRRKTALVRRKSVATLPNPTQPYPTQPYPTVQKTGGRVFLKPTAQEVTNYAKTLYFSLDGQQFVDFYESKGWKIGNSPMKNWQAAVRTWKKRHEGGNNARTSSHIRLEQNDTERRKAYES